jgi:hypothetical protein
MKYNGIELVDVSQKESITNDDPIEMICWNDGDIPVRCIVYAIVPGSRYPVITDCNRCIVFQHCAYNNVF